MRIRQIVLIVLAVGLSLADVQAQAQFNIVATVLEPGTGKSVETLTPSDVSVTEDGVTASIAKVEPIVQTVSVQVLIDNGTGVAKYIAEVRNGLRELLKALPPDVETTVVTTSPQPRFLVRATTSREELLKGVDRLAPDTGGGSFVDSLIEAAERSNKRKDVFTVIITAGSTTGDARVDERQMQRALDQIRGKPMLVHVLLFAGTQSASGGTAQVDVGERAAQMTGGRYEYVNTMTRYVAVMAELGANVAKEFAGSTRQFRITVNRPAGKKGELGKINITAVSKTLGTLRLE